MGRQTRNARRLAGVAAACGLFAATAPTMAATITFDDLVTGATSYGFDGDGDGLADVVFSTTDPDGFNTIGPGLNQNDIQEPGLEGTALLPIDLRVDFNKAPTGSLRFGFALDSTVADPAYFADFKVYDKNGVLLADKSVVGQYTTTAAGTSSFPEGVLTVDFGGQAAYGTFNFTSEQGRYIIDNFTGNFGSVAVPVPEPSSWLLAAGGLGGLLLRRRRGATMG